MSQSPIIMDGRRLAARRAPAIAAGAARVAAARGRPPHLLLAAFDDGSGQAPHLAGKLRACAAAGVETSTLLLEPNTNAAAGADLLRQQLSESAPDALFLQFPYPEGLDPAPLIEAIPAELDVDIMTPARVEKYLLGGSPFPPVTVSAALQLIESYAIDIQGLRGVVVGAVTPFCLMFREALTRRGAHLEPIIAANAPDLKLHVLDAQLVVVAAATPGILRSSDLTAGTVAIDSGYYNPGGLGDIDLSDGIEHLHSFAPVPGGIGPMTVCTLIERVIEFASLSTGRATARADQT